MVDKTMVILVIAVILSFVVFVSSAVAVSKINSSISAGATDPALEMAKHASVLNLVLGLFIFVGVGIAIFYLNREHIRGFVTSRFRTGGAPSALV